MFASGLRLEWERIINGEIKFFRKAEELLVTIYDDFLEGVPNEDIQLLRDSDEWDGRFVRIYHRLRAAFPTETTTQLASVARDELLRMKWTGSEKITEYNQRYKNAFMKAYKFKRAFDGPMAVEDYLKSLPQNNTNLMMMQMNIQDADYSTLDAAMTKFAIMIKRIYPNEVLNAHIGAVEETPRRARRNANATQCKKCGFKIIHTEQKPCLALGKICRKCGKKNHFEKVCTSKDGADVAGFVGGVKSDDRLIGIDSCACTSIVSDRGRLVEIDHTPKSLTMPNEEKIDVVHGQEDFDFKNEDGAAFSLRLPTSLIDDAPMDLISMLDLVKAGCKIEISDQPSLRYNDTYIPLEWQNNLLVVASRRPREIDNVLGGVSSPRLLHERFGHISSKTLKKMFGVELPDDFNCAICNQKNRKNFGPGSKNNLEDERRLSEPYDVVHMDILTAHGDLSPITRFLVIVDARSRMSHVTPMKTLDGQESINAVSRFLVKNQISPRRLITDRQPAFRSAEFRNWCLSQGIDLVFCSPNQHQQNGLVERLIQTVRKKAVTL